MKTAENLFAEGGKGHEHAGGPPALQEATVAGHFQWIPIVSNAFQSILTTLGKNMKISGGRRLYSGLKGHRRQTEFNRFKPNSTPFNLLF
ncbi:MAG TPA: hypothetical protein VG347_01220 [Verrucomicrobiae bacterium]|nr:hypothetical protein [Verrucomicrobiae bacterium]